jgi:branched-subunit amino acid transport protein
MKTNLIIIVLAMGIVTYIPRMIPMVLLNNIKLPSFFKSFFQFIPFAALGALIFPGVLSSTGDIRSAVTGSIIAALLSFFRMNVMIVVFVSILSVFICQML